MAGAKHQSKNQIYNI